jgi:hypothetical protein
MTTLGKAAIGLGVVLVVGAVVYPNVQASLLRHRATSRIDAADAMQAQVTSPVAKTSLEDATIALRLILRSADAPTAAVAQADAALADVMETLKVSPPSEHPVIATLAHGTEARAGQVFPVTVNVSTDVSEAFVVQIIAQFELQSGWKSDEIRRDVRRPIGREGVKGTLVEFALPKDAAGRGWIHTTVVYRLSRTGEGRDFHEAARDAAPITIVR